jgi:opacity protein-like surface antigen
MRVTTVAGRSVRVALVSVAILLGAANPSFSQAYISPLIGYNFGGDAGCPEISNCEDKNLNWGVAFGAAGPIIGAEFEFAYATNFFGDVPDAESNVLTMMGNFMLAPRFGPVQPYGLIGFGLVKSHVDTSVSGIFESDNNNFGWNLGGGLFIFFGGHFGLRGDIRYFHSFQDLDLVFTTDEGIKLDYGRASGAVVFRF